MPQQTPSKLACIALSCARSYPSSICPGRVYTAWLVSLVVVSCCMVSKWWHVKSTGCLWGGWCAVPTSFSLYHSVYFSIHLYIYTFFYTFLVLLLIYIPPLYLCSSIFIRVPFSLSVNSSIILSISLPPCISLFLSSSLPPSTHLPVSLSCVVDLYRHLYIPTSQ